MDQFLSENPKPNKVNNNFKTFIRWSKGIDINAACGQLATENGS